MSEDKKDALDQAIDPVLDPKASPLRPGQGVRRVNNFPIGILGTLVAVVLGIIVYVGASRAAPQQGSDTPGKVESTKSHAEAIAGQKEAGEVPAEGEPDQGTGTPGEEKTPESQPDGGTKAAKSKLPDDFPDPPGPPKTGLGGGTKTDEETGMGTGPGLGRPGSDTAVDELSAMRLQLFKTAIQSGTTVEMGDSDAPGAMEGRRSSGSHVTGRGGYLERLKDLQRAGLLPEDEARGASAGSYERFEGRQGEDRWQSGAELEAPNSPFELRAGAVLPATLVSGINSDLPGQITALVAQDVRDTATGRHVLIPQASRLVGTYGADVKFGQERVLVAWQRIVFPDGKALDIGAMPGADGAGYAGFADLVDNHYFRLFASAILMSGITAGISVSQDSVRDENGRPTMSGAMTESLGQQLGQLSEELIKRQMNVAPTIEIRPGYRFNVQVTKDLTFNGPYRAYDWQRQISTGAQSFRVRR